jgi:hypothetical protein
MPWRFCCRLGVRREWEVEALLVGPLPLVELDAPLWFEGVFPILFTYRYLTVFGAKISVALEHGGRRIVPDAVQAVT